KLDGAALGLGPAEQAKVDIVRDRGLESLAIMRDAGLPMAFGTDLLGQLRQYGGFEFELLGKVLSPVEVLRSVGEISAKLCRQEGEIGVIAKGARANLVVVDGDPLQDIALLGRPDETLRAVIKDGRVVRGALAEAA